MYLTADGWLAAGGGLGGEGEGEGEAAVLTTVPLTIHPATLRLNLDTSRPGASVRVALCDPFDRVLPGFEAENCVPITGVDSTEQHVQWLGADGRALPFGGQGEGGDALEEKMVSQSRGTVKLRITLSGPAELFAIYP